MTTPPAQPATQPEPKKPHERAGELLVAGRLAECERLCDEHLAGEADFARLHYYRGLSLHRQRRCAEAEPELRRAIALLPGWGRAHLDLALCLTRLGRDDEAWAELEHAERLIRKDQRGLVWTCMAEHLQRQRRPGEALAYAEKAIAEDGPRPRLARLVGALARQAGELERSRTALEDAVRGEPADASLRAELGWTLALLGRDDEAKQHYELADRLEGDRPEPRAAWLVSYPKCGVTWLRYMLMQVLAQAVGDALPVESLWLARMSQRREDWPVMRWTHEDAPIVKEDGEPVDTRRLWIANGRARFARQRVVLLVRDPRDVVVSLYHQATKRSAVPLSFASLGAFVRDPGLGLDRVLRFYEVWDAAANEPSACTIVGYEQLLTDPVGGLVRVLAGLGYEPMPRAWLETAARLGEARRLRERERAGAVEGMRVFDASDPDALKVRRAAAGTHRDEMDAELIAWCDARLSRVPERIARAIWPGGAPSAARVPAHSAGR